MAQPGPTLNFIADLKAIAPANRVHGSAYIVMYPAGDESILPAWYVLKGSSTTAESLPNVVAPNTGSGRWFKI